MRLFFRIAAWSGMLGLAGCCTKVDCSGPVGLSLSFTGMPLSVARAGAVVYRLDAGAGFSSPPLDSLRIDSVYVDSAGVAHLTDQQSYSTSGGSPANYLRMPDSYLLRFVDGGRAYEITTNAATGDCNQCFLKNDPYRFLSGSTINGVEYRTTVIQLPY